jgi:hypothetical protein
MTTTEIPTWLAELIKIKTGAPPGARNARPHRCSTCKTRVLIGLSDDVCALTVTVDPTPVNTLGEALARLTNRATYTLHRHGRSWRLNRRDRWQITGEPAGTRTGPLGYDVLTEHRCQQPLPSAPSVYTHLGTLHAGPDTLPPF